MTGGRSQRLRASTPCASFFARVRARTSRSRRLVNRRSDRVRSSGVHTSSSRPETSSRASVRASSRSVFAFASVIDLSLRVLATITRIPFACSSETILSAPLVASNATTSPATRLCANSSSEPTRVATRPADLIAPPSAIATSQKSRCTSNPNARTPSPFLDRVGARRDTRQRRIRARRPYPKNAFRLTPSIAKRSFNYEVRSRASASST